MENLVMKLISLNHDSKKEKYFHKDNWPCSGNIQDWANLQVELKISKRALSEFRSLIAIEDEMDKMMSLMNLLQGQSIIQTFKPKFFKYCET